jgi:hypothetical protein
MSDPELEKLRAAFRSLGGDARPGADCPEAARLWEAASGALPAAARREIVDHTAGCAVCAEAWRLAVEVRSDAAAAMAPAPRFWSTRGLPAFAMAAVLVLAAAAGVILLRAPDDAPSYRDAAGASVSALVPPDQPLARDDFRLRWSSAAEGSRYEVRVTTESLETVATARDLGEPAFLVPESALGSLPSGSRLLWQVRVTLPDGQRSDSQTFVATLR